MNFDDLTSAQTEPIPQKITGKVLPLWIKGNPEVTFLDRTNTVYSSIPISDLKERGLGSSLFDNLTANLPEGVYNCRRVYGIFITRR